MNDVKLAISDFTCTECGYTWTHSEPIMRTDDGGYIDLSDPREFDKWIRRSAQITCYSRHRYLAPICHRCLPLGLHEGWTTPKLPTQEKKELSDDDLDRLLRS